MPKQEPIVVYAYSLQQAFNDGVLSPLWPKRWHTLTRGKPIVVTRSVNADFTEAALVELWNDFVHWRREVMPTLPDEDRMFTSSVNDHKVWLIEDGQAFTILYPEDY